MYSIIIREDGNKHPIISGIRASIDPNNLCGVYDIRKITDLFRIVFHSSEKLIITDPAVYLLTIILKPNAKKIFFSLEMFEFQRFNKGILVIRNLFFRLTHFLALKNSSMVIFPNKARFRFYLFKGWINKEKCKIIENLPSLNTINIMKECKKRSKIEVRKEVFKMLNLPSNLNNKMVFVYAGAIDERRRIPDLIKFIKEDKNKILILAGNDKSKINFKTMPNVFYVGLLDQKLSLNLVYAADYQIAYYSEDLINTKLCSPVKVYESLYLGIPIFINRNPGTLSLSISEHLYYFDKIEDIVEIKKDYHSGRFEKDEYKNFIRKINPIETEIRKILSC